MTATAEWIGDYSVLYEQPESGQLTLDTKATLTKIYEGRKALAYANCLARGTLGSGATAGFVVAKSQVDPTTGGRAKLTIVWEAGAESGQPLPPDDFDVDPFEINPKVDRHPLFQPLTQHQRDIVRARVAAMSAEARDTAATVIDNEPQSLLMQKLIEKLTRGQENYYLAGIKYTWTLYFYFRQVPNRGGYLEQPSGPMAGYLPSDLGWLRLADKVQPVGTNGAYKVTRSWLGGPDGHWDNDLYNV